MRTPATRPSVENARGIESKPAPMMVFTNEMEDDMVEAPWSTEGILL